MYSVDELAQRLLQEHDSRTPFTSLARDAGITGVGPAYDIQSAYVEKLLARERTTPAGYKIGLTSPRMQEMCGIGHPIAGVVFNNRVRSSGLKVSLAEYVPLGVEFEIAVRLGCDIGAGNCPQNVTEMSQAV